MLSSLVLIALAALQAEVPDKRADPVVCKTPRVTEVGTRMKRKQVCMLQSQWEYETKTTRRELEQLTQKGRDPGQALGR